MRFRMLIGAGALALGLVAAAAGAPANDSCLYAHDGVCDEARYGGQGLCADGADTSDCSRAPDAAPVPAACEFTGDGECDEAPWGTGFCAAGTDVVDCRALAAGGDDSCEYARDGVCDENGHIGSRACTDGTDLTDCSALYGMRNRNNWCATPFDGVCNEPELGDGTCDSRTDTVDCLGRETLFGLQGYFFGHDDRVLIDPAGLPWSAIGQLEMESGGACSGALVSERVVLTAAHCLVAENDGVDAPVRFRAGLDGERALATAAAVDWRIAPDYRAERDGADQGHDWAFVLLDRDLGSTVGMLGVHRISADDIALIEAGRFPLVLHGGYPWDADSRMIGHVGCVVAAIRDDNSIIHQCDTTEGDSGSPIIVIDANRFAVLAVDSEFLSGDHGKTTNLAVDARAFIGPLEDYIAETALADPTPLARSGIRELQRLLNTLGYDAGEADGLTGPRTRAAIVAFCKAQGLVVPAAPTAGLLERVREAAAG